jgi:hypothetical protein
VDDIPNQTVVICRVDIVWVDEIEVGDTVVSLGDPQVYPDDARELAALLISAADMADGKL